MAVENKRQADRRDNAGVRYKRVTAATTLNPWENIVAATPAAADYVITLPPVSECAGEWFFIWSVSNADGKVTAEGAGDERTDFTTSDLTTTADYSLIFCTGLDWIEVKTVST